MTAGRPNAAAMLATVNVLALAMYRLCDLADLLWRRPVDMPSVRARFSKNLRAPSRAIDRFLGRLPVSAGPW